MSDDIYRKLATVLDTLPNGFPATESGVEMTTAELQEFARLTGNDDVHGLSISDLCTTNSEISGHTDIEHV